MTTAILVAIALTLACRARDVRLWNRSVVTASAAMPNRLVSRECDGRPA